jgi:hypothetical protein
VTVLNYPFEPSAIPASERGTEAEYRAAFADARVYLVRFFLEFVDGDLQCFVLPRDDCALWFQVGTAHFSVESQQDVLQTIDSVQPDMVMVELCPSRISILSMVRSRHETGGRAAL